MKLIITTITLLSFGFSQMGITLHGGFGMNNIGGDATEGMEAKMKTGLHIGVSKQLMENCIVGVGYTQRGSKMTPEATGDALVDALLEAMEMEYSMDYLDLYALYPIPVELPVMLFAGLNVGINVKSEVSFMGEAVDMSEDTESLDYGLLLGGSYPINETMSVSAGYYLGLANFTGESEVTGTHNSIWTMFNYNL